MYKYILTGAALMIAPALNAQVHRDVQRSTTTDVHRTGKANIHRTTMRTVNRTTNVNVNRKYDPYNLNED